MEYVIFDTTDGREIAINPDNVLFLEKVDAGTTKTYVVGRNEPLLVNRGYCDMMRELEESAE